VSAAHELRARGAEVLLLDRGEVSSGTTGLGEGNVLVCDKPPGPERELALLGRAMWEEMGAEFPEARVTRKGALLLREGGGGLGPAGPDPRAIEPELAPGLDYEHEPADLQVDPQGLVRALASPMTKFQDCEIAKIEPGSLTLSTGQRWRYETVVVAAGPWSGPLTGLPVEPRKGQLVALRADGVTINHKLIAASYLDAVEAPTDDLVIAPVIEQTLDGDELLVGSSRERVGFDDAVRPEVTRAMIAAAARYVPAVARLPVTRAWCGFRPWLPDGLPAIGELREGVYVSTGHEGAGVGLGPISGRLLAQMIAGEEPVMDPSPFDPQRFL
jgi:glycine/D-amino acid oxidase-like deaminating enzyme